MVKNRENNDKLLVCAEENKVYLWKATDGKPFHIAFLLYKMTQFTETNQDFANESLQGSNPTGEYFNPAYDCSDALNKISEAKDGFYWIKLSGNVPKKVVLYVIHACLLHFMIIIKFTTLLYNTFCFRPIVT